MPLAPTSKLLQCLHTTPCFSTDLTNCSKSNHRNNLNYHLSNLLLSKLVVGITSCHSFIVSCPLKKFRHIILLMMLQLLQKGKDDKFSGMEFGEGYRVTHPSNSNLDLLLLPSHCHYASLAGLLFSYWWVSNAYEPSFG